MINWVIIIGLILVIAIAGYREISFWCSLDNQPIDPVVPSIYEWNDVNITLPELKEIKYDDVPQMTSDLLWLRL